MAQQSFAEMKHCTYLVKTSILVCNSKSECVVSSANLYDMLNLFMTQVDSWSVLHYHFLFIVLLSILYHYNELLTNHQEIIPVRAHRSCCNDGYLFRCRYTSNRYASERTNTCFAFHFIIQSVIFLGTQVLQNIPEVKKVWKIFMCHTCLYNTATHFTFHIKLLKC